MAKKKSASAPAPAAHTTPELLKHEWSPEGICLNPETILIDISREDHGAHLKLGAVIMLAAVADSTWRFGYAVQLLEGDEIRELRESQNPYATRDAALGAAFGELIRVLSEAGDTHGKKAVKAFIANLGVSPIAALVERDTASTVAALGPLPKGRFAEIPLANIQANPENPRKHFDPVAIRELADSIQLQGLLQPIAVRRMLPEELGESPEIAAAVPPERYEIILGERRWRAAQLPVRDATGLVATSGSILELIDAKVYEGVTRAQGRAAALVENLQRERMNPIEEAEGFRDLMASTVPPLTQEQCAEAVGKSRPVIANALRVLELGEKVAAEIRKGAITMAHGVALARFKAFPQAVAILLDEAIQYKVPATVLEKDVPFQGALLRAGVAVMANSHELGGTFPGSLKKHPAYFKSNDWAYLCFDAAHWKGLVDAYEAERKAEADKAAAAEQKRLAAAAKNPAKIKSLDDLPHGSYARVDKDSQSLLSLVPQSSRLDLKDEGEAVTVCTEPDLFRKIKIELENLKRADRKEKLPRMFGLALETTRKVKKMGPREMMLLTFMASASEDRFPEYTVPGFTDRAQKSANKEVPKKAFDLSGSGEMHLTCSALSAMMEKLTAVEMYQILVCEWLICAENECMENGWGNGYDSDTAHLLRWILDVDDLGLLEENKPGQKQLLAALKAADWYKAALTNLDDAAEKAAAGKDGKAA